MCPIPSSCKGCCYPTVIVLKWLSSTSEFSFRNGIDRCPMLFFKCHYSKLMGTQWVIMGITRGRGELWPLHSAWNYKADFSPDKFCFCKTQHHYTTTPQHHYTTTPLHRGRDKASTAGGGSVCIEGRYCGTLGARHFQQTLRCRSHLWNR